MLHSRTTVTGSGSSASAPFRLPEYGCASLQSASPAGEPCDWTCDAVHTRSRLHGNCRRSATLMLPARQHLPLRSSHGLRRGLAPGRFATRCGGYLSVRSHWLKADPARAAARHPPTPLHPRRVGLEHPTPPALAHDIMHTHMHMLDVVLGVWCPPAQRRGCSSDGQVV